MRGDQAQNGNRECASQIARARALAGRARELRAYRRELIARLKLLAARAQHNWQEMDQLFAALKDSKARGRKAGRRPTTLGGTKHILVVDDDACSRYALTRFIVGAGLGCQAVARSGALRSLEFTTFDLVITHIHKTGVEGDRLAEEIKRRNPRLPVILITATPPSEPLASIDRILVKTFTLKELSTAIAAHLGSSAVPGEAPPDASDRPQP